MGFHLPSHVSFCRVADRTFLLDLRRDWYFQLDPSLEPVFRALTQPEPNAVDLAAAQRLVELGVICEVDGPQAPLEAAAAIPPMDSWRETAVPGVASPIFILEVWSALWRARRVVSRLPLERLIAQLQARKRASAAAPATTERLKAVALRFNGARRGAPIDPICLQDSLALLSILARRRLWADFVIGVTAAPFAAHCWVQTGACVLNETLDEARRFQPILVV